MTGKLDYADQSPYSLSAYVILLTFSVFFVALRVFVKAKIVRLWGYEDYATIFALVFDIAAMVFLFCEESISGGNYNLVSALLQTDIPLRLKYLYTINILYNLSVTCIKISFLLLYLRIFHQKSIRIAIWIGFGVVILYSCWALFTNIFICWPINAFWNAPIPFESEKCLDTFHIFLSQSVLNTATDLLLILLPLPGLRHLMLPRGQKIALVLVFLLGSFICIASILRMLAFIRAFGDGTYNLVWGGRSVAIWTAIEMNVSIICACLPPLRLLIMRLFSSRMRLGKSADRSRSFVSNKIISGNGIKPVHKFLRSRGGDGEERLSSSPSDNGRASTSRTDTKCKQEICVTTEHTINYDCNKTTTAGSGYLKGEVWDGVAV